MIHNSGTSKVLDESEIFDNLYHNIEHLPVAMAILSHSGKTIKYVNKSFFELFGYDSNCENNNDNENIYSSLHHQLIQKTASAACKLGRAVKEDGIEVSIVKTTGVERKILDFQASPILDNGNAQTSGILITFIDTTKEIEYQKRFGESERSYRNLMETMAVAVYTCDLEGRVNFHNDAAVSLWGRKPELGVELWCGSHKMYTLDGTWMPHDQCPAAISLKERRAVKAEALVQRPDGKIRHVLVFPRPEYDINGHMIGLINAVVDITERKILERQKDEFMGIIAHELKTPITSIKGYAQLLTGQISDFDNETVDKLKGRMFIQINSLINLIDKMLDVAKIETGERQFKKEKFDLLLLINSVVEDVQQSTKSHELIFDSLTSVNVAGDQEYIKQAIINLLSNAIKYSPKADRVIIDLREENGSAVCGVRDFGVGIPSDQVGTIFEKFYRVKTEAVNNIAGIGLGLYLSAEIIRQTGGAIWVESKINEGSTFSFSLPVC